MMKKFFVTFLILFLFFLGMDCHAVNYETEPNNDMKQANPLVSGEPIIGQLSSERDRDWFCIRASSKEVISAIFHTENGSYGPGVLWTITIQDAFGRVLASIISRDKEEEPKELSTTAPTSGTYCVIITGTRDSNYSLSVSASRPAHTHSKNIR